MEVNVSKYKLAVFDLDGTILDTTEGVIASVKHTIQTMDYKMPTDEELSSFIGPPIQDSFAKYYGLSGSILQEIATIFRDQYKNVDLLKAKAYQGIYELFEKMLDKGITPAVATYKREDYALTLLKYYHFDKYTSIMYGADHENKLKKRDIIEKCISDANITNYSEVVMIGDTIYDANGAAQIGVDFIGVTYGFGFKKKEDLEKLPFVGCAKTPIEILDYIYL